MRADWQEEAACAPHWSRSMIFLFQTLYGFMCNILSRMVIGSEGKGDYFFICRSLMQGSVRCFFFLSAKHQKALFSLWQRSLLHLPAYIIKCAIWSTDFHPEFAFLCYIPAACRHPCAAITTPPVSLSGSWGSEREQLKGKRRRLCNKSHI